MNTSPLTIFPVLRRTFDSDKSRSEYLRQASAITKGLDPSSSKFTLDVAKRIWATYSGNPIDKTAETEVAWNTNALALHLGEEEYTTSLTDMTSHEPFVNGAGNEGIAVIQPKSSGSERDVDELLPTADDAIEIPSANAHQLSPNSNPLHFSDNRSQTLMYQETATQPHASASIDPLNEMRGALMNSFQKAIHLRYPQLDVDVNRLRENFAKKLTDVEVQDFMRMGRAVVEDLKRSGKIVETKRKLAMQEQNDESEARRNRRRIDRSSSLVPANDPKSTDHVDVLHQGDLSTVSGTPIVPTTTPPFPPSSVSDLGTERSSTPIRTSTQQGTLLSSHPIQDVSMTVPPSIPSSPPPRPSSIPSDSDDRMDVSIPSHANTQDADAHPHENEPADQDTINIDDTISDLGVPRILLAKVGQPIADVTDVAFDINEQLFIAAQRWAQYWKEYNPNELHVRLYLTSIPTTAAENAHCELPPNSSLSRLAEAVAKINVVWPPSRTFYVTLNEGRPEAMSWGDQFFGPSSPPLDISDGVVSGKNVIRFIQLEDLSQRLFLVLAMPPSEWEKQKRAIWKKQLAQHMTSATIRVQS